MVKRVYGTCGGADILFHPGEGGRWESAVPSSLGGEYTVSLYAEDEAGNSAYMATILFAVDLNSLCMRLVLLDVDAHADMPMLRAIAALSDVAAEPGRAEVRADAHMMDISATVIRCARCGR